MNIADPCLLCVAGSRPLTALSRLSDHHFENIVGTAETPEQRHAEGSQNSVEPVRLGAGQLVIETAEQQCRTKRERYERTQDEQRYRTTGDPALVRFQAFNNRRQAQCNFRHWPE